ncbi:hypothetical protein EDEG_02881 [Edhazardia aedis USNM 41457]|uniref:Uncharacterized protein n=1 Tax=Edhazardia aedis (strain USNM 41457) TaxID=1003232 RepID=J9DMX4_EDHAE|nr:hypothetical protein EDEG_02881 [Edhazardia aedis USNM 41457]|eukprot:EJW02697.1 hypothetical protein EDEG_02881 [Edhazardia aedis USNM 41457]
MQYTCFLLKYAYILFNYVFSRNLFSMLTIYALVLKKIIINRGGSMVRSMGIESHNSLTISKLSWNKPSIKVSTSIYNKYTNNDVMPLKCIYSIYARFSNKLLLDYSNKGLISS